MFFSPSLHASNPLTHAYRENGWRYFVSKITRPPCLSCTRALTSLHFLPPHFHTDTRAGAHTHTAGSYSCAHSLFLLFRGGDDVLFTRARVPVIIVRTHEQLKITYTRTIDSSVSLKMHHCLKRSLRSIKLVWALHVSAGAEKIRAVNNDVR